jgi:mannose-1-phosphate guanylyltransferase/mannose-6-phosphate isomerase
MIVVIIAGGSGTRLWPLSTPDYPKHLLKLDDSGDSLLQSTYQRAQQLGDQIYVVSDASHIEHVKQQLPDMPGDNFIIEPARRGTANCIIAALAQVAKDHDAGEPIAFIHADHFIRDSAGFSHSLNLAAEAAAAHQRIVLVGVEPDYPATIFGYIEKGELFDKARLAYDVRSFKEKPSFEVAKEYLASGNYLWNCGYFVGSIDTFVSKMRAYAPELLASYEKLTAATDKDYAATYLELETDAIDYALIEKVEDLLVIPAEFDWMDVGSFGDLHKAVGGDAQGNSLQGQVEIEAVTNSLVKNTESKPVVVIGLNDIVVVNTPSGILVARKDLAYQVGAVSKRLPKPE